MKGKSIITWVLILALVVAGIWGYNQYMDKTNYRTYLENQYKNDFYSLIESLENIEALLAKSIISQSDNQMSLLFTETWKMADLAQMNLNRLPISHLSLKETSKFLTQLGDFSYSLGKETIDNKEINEKQRKDIERLHNNSAYLVTSLQKLHEDMIAGSINFGELRSKGRLALRKASNNVIEEKLTKVEKEMVAYPKLIYDGPFSEHLQDITPKKPQGKEITREEGEKKVLSFLGKDRIQKINQLGKGNGVVKTYSYEVVPEKEEEDRRIYIEVNKDGGQVAWMIDSKVVKNVRLSMPKALERAKEFLEKKGYSNMVPTYSEKYNGVGVFNFAYQQGDVLIYPDLIKVQVALDNGEIMGFEGQGFLVAHKDRKIPKPTIKEEEAMAKVSKDLEIFKKRLAMIPTETKEEVLCYEFKGKLEEDVFIVYINALTGEEQEILKVLNTKGGDLTM